MWIRPRSKCVKKMGIKYFTPNLPEPDPAWAPTNIVADPRAPFGAGTEVPGIGDDTSHDV
jgi:hypothetical protein